MTLPCPIQTADPVRGANENETEFNVRKREHAPVIMAYDFERVKWDLLNRKCLMVIKSSIVEGIRGAPKWHNRH